VIRLKLSIEQNGQRNVASDRHAVNQFAGIIAHPSMQE